MRQTIDAARCRLLWGGKHGQNGMQAAIGTTPRGPVYDSFVVLPQHCFKPVISISAEPGGWVHVPHSSQQPVPHAADEALRLPLIHREIRPKEMLFTTTCCD